MILSTGRKYVFIHIPKTGGTSMALALENRAMKDDLMLGDTPKAKRRRRRLRDTNARGRLWKHSTMRDIDGLVPDDVLHGLFAFTLVRNPWDRVVSYYHWLQKQDFAHPSVGLSKKLSFTEFVAHPRIQSGFRGTPAAYYMRRADGEEQCQAYIRLEQFEEDAVPLFDHLGFRLALPRTNQSERTGDYRALYDDASAEAIAACCAEDIARFGYQFG